MRNRDKFHRAIERAFVEVAEELRQQAGLTHEQLREKMNEPEAREAGHRQLRGLVLALRERREAAGVAIERLAELSGVSAEKIGAWERGERLEEMALTDGFDLALALGLNIADLVREAEQ